MRKKRIPDTHGRRPDSIERRTALKGLGALALYGPVLAGIACDGDSEGTDVNRGPAASGGDGGSPPGSGVGMPGATGGGSDAGGQVSVADSGSGSGGTGGGSDSGAATRPDAGNGGALDAGGPRDSGVSPPLGDAGASSAGLFPPMFTDAPMCTLTATDPASEGPFFLHEDEVMTDPVLNRVDIRDGHEGVELQLSFRLLDADGMCMKPIADVEVYAWHTDAMGFYSGFANQNPDRTYMGGIERTVENADRFCRGLQVTNAEGVVSFRTLYPGWYFGRPVHIHFVALRKGSMAATSSYRSTQYHMFTTQLYFEEQFSRMIHENNMPYKTRASGSGYDMYVKPSSSMVRPSVRMEGNVAVASLNIITRASASRR